MKIIKKLVAALLLSLLFCFDALALSTDIITPDSEFIIYSADKERVSEILNTTVSELESTIEKQGFIFLAVNSDNSKQIQMTQTVTDFSNTAGDLSNFSDESILSLLPDITGMKNIKGSVVLKDGQKYAFINLKQEDSGYILTQYFTVKDKKLYTVTFYTENDVSTDYISTAFPTENNNATVVPANSNGVKIAVVIGTVVFGIIFAYILYTLIVDFIKATHKNQE